MAHILERFQQLESTISVAGSAPSSTLPSLVKDGECNKQDVQAGDGTAKEHNKSVSFGDDASGSHQRRKDKKDQASV